MHWQDVHLMTYLFSYWLYVFTPEEELSIVRNVEPLINQKIPYLSIPWNCSQLTIIPSPKTEENFAHFGMYAILWRFQSFYGSPPQANFMPTCAKFTSVLGEGIITGKIFCTFWIKEYFAKVEAMAWVLEMVLAQHNQKRLIEQLREQCTQMWIDSFSRKHERRLRLPYLAHIRTHKYETLTNHDYTSISLCYTYHHWSKTQIDSDILYTGSLRQRGSCEPGDQNVWFPLVTGAPIIFLYIHSSVNENIDVNSQRWPWIYPVIE